MLGIDIELVEIVLDLGLQDEILSRDVKHWKYDRTKLAGFTQVSSVNKRRYCGIQITRLISEDDTNALAISFDANLL